MSVRLLSTVAAAIVLTAGQAHAFGEVGPLPVATTVASTVTAADVSAQARQAQRAGLLVNGEAGQLRADTGTAARQPVTARADAATLRAAAQRIGASGNGEAGTSAGTARAPGSLVAPSDVRAQILVPTL